ncbi:GspH/FimT family pseudopilin [Glaciecola sp. MH2013]|nr:GspH/FimT family pseudopilin [Glaciecola sp. MH2013]
MITVSILAVALTVVSPNIKDFLTKNRITGEINEISGLIQYARHLSIDEQTPVTVCPSSNYSDCSNDWNDPKIAFIDRNGDGQRNDNEANANFEDLRIASTASSDSTTMTGPNATIEFEENGVASQGFTLLICPDTNDAKFARAVNVSLQGRVRVSKDTDGDGVHEKPDGSPLTCS